MKVKNIFNLIWFLTFFLAGCVTTEYNNENTSFLGKGINLGNYFEAPRDINNDGIYDTEDGEGNWTGDRKVLKSDLELIKKTGFDNIRIPVRWSDYFTLEHPYELEKGNGEKRLSRVKEVISWAKELNLKVVVNIHHYTQLMDGTLLSRKEHTERLKAIWTKLCSEFPINEYPEDFLIFELLNEPHTRVGYTAWNQIISELTPIIWEKSSKRKIMIGTANWGGVPGLYQLELPKECNPSNTIISVHYYEPHHFTHQGAEWNQGSEAWIGTSWTGTEAEKYNLTSLFNDIDMWNTNNYEVYVGEFGVYSKYSENEHQKLWTSFIVNESNKRGYSWAYWEFSEGFGAFDKNTNKWKPHLINALLPGTID